MRFDAQVRHALGELLHDDFAGAAFGLCGVAPRGRLGVIVDFLDLLGTPLKVRVVAGVRFSTGERFDLPWAA